MPIRRPHALVLVFAWLLVAAPAARAAGHYVVRPGDTLSGIAVRFDTTVLALARANGLDRERFLLVGTRLRIPGAARAVRARPVSYRVSAGDTLSAIALRHGTTVAALARANGLDPANILLAGAKLRIPGIPAKRLGTAAAPAWAVRASLDYWARRYHVDSRLVRALAWMESGYQSHVVSRANAHGVMQITPATWDFAETVLIGRNVPNTADGNVRVGVAFLHHLLHVFDFDVRLALGAYYQGIRAVRRHGLYAETERYVDDVLALRERV